jgi:hypothetical protein
MMSSAARGCLLLSFSHDIMREISQENIRSDKYDGNSNRSLETRDNVQSVAMLKLCNQQRRKRNEKKKTRQLFDFLSLSTHPTT